MVAFRTFTDQGARPSGGAAQHGQTPAPCRPPWQHPTKRRASCYRLLQLQSQCRSCHQQCSLLPWACAAAAGSALCGRCCRRIGCPQISLGGTYWCQPPRCEGSGTCAAAAAGLASAAAAPGAAPLLAAAAAWKQMRLRWPHRQTPSRFVPRPAAPAAPAATFRCKPAARGPLAGCCSVHHTQETRPPG